MCRREHAGRTETALQRMMLAEGRLQGRKPVLAGQPFDGQHGGTMRLNREHETGTHGGAVHNHRARAADAVLAANMGAGEPQNVAKAVGQCGARSHVNLDALAVNLENRGQDCSAAMPMRA
jgi:hypothetical protein